MSEQRRKSRYTAESETELNAVAAENNNLHIYNEGKIEVIDNKKSNKFEYVISWIGAN